MTPVNRYLSLERSFAEPGKAKESEDLALRSYIGRAMGASPDIASPNIYRDGRSCVILGEARSGADLARAFRRIALKPVVPLDGYLHDAIPRACAITAYFISSSLTRRRRAADMSWES